MKKEKRPIIITIICILGFLGSGIGIFTPLINYFPQEVLNQMEITFSTNFLIFTSLISIGLLGSFILIWKMKKLGIYLYLILSLINFSSGYRQGISSPRSLIFPGIFIAICYYNFKKFR